MKERRFVPRYDCDFSVAVEVEKQRHEFAARNISALGLAIEFSQSVKLALEVSGISLDAGDHLNLLLPEPGEESPSVLTACQVQYVRRLSQDSWFMGCQFVAPDSAVERLVEDWIQHR